MDVSGEIRVQIIQKHLSEGTGFLNVIKIKQPRTRCLELLTRTECLIDSSGSKERKESTFINSEHGTITQLGAQKGKQSGLTGIIKLGNVGARFLTWISLLTNLSFIFIITKMRLLGYIEQ